MFLDNAFLLSVSSSAAKERCGGARGGREVKEGSLQSPRFAATFKVRMGAPCLGLDCD